LLFYFKFYHLDIDECTAGTDTCDTDATCTNTAGDYECDCNTGYSGTGFECSDVDECTVGGHTCDEDASCDNTVGSYICTCGDQFTGNGELCLRKLNFGLQNVNKTKIKIKLLRDCRLKKKFQGLQDGDIFHTKSIFVFLDQCFLYHNF